MRQAEDRAHRSGQRVPVNIYFLCAKSTSDDRCGLTFRVHPLSLMTSTVLSVCTYLERDELLSVGPW